MALDSGPAAPSRDGHWVAGANEFCRLLSCSLHLRVVSRNRADLSPRRMPRGYPSKIRMPQSGAHCLSASHTENKLGMPQDATLRSLHGHYICASQFEKSITPHLHRVDLYNHNLLYDLMASNLNL